MGNAFTETRFAICGSRVRNSTSAPELDRVDQDAAPSASPLRENPFSSDVDRARHRRIVSSPCQHLQILRKTTRYDVPAVEADILTLHKLLQQVSEELFGSQG